MTIHACVNDTSSTPFCGPTVIGAVTGNPISKAKWAIRDGRIKRGIPIRSINGRFLPIKGTSVQDLGAGFNALGYTMSLSDTYEGKSPKERPTLAAWIASRDDDDKKRTFIICVGGGRDGGGHWVALHGGTFADTFTKGLPVHISEAPWRRSRVESVYWVRPKR